MRLAPVPGLGTRLELHRRHIGAGHNEMAFDVAHVEGGQGQTSWRSSPGGVCAAMAKSWAMRTD